MLFRSVQQRRLRMWLPTRQFGTLMCSVGQMLDANTRIVGVSFNSRSERKIAAEIVLERSQEQGLTIISLDNEYAHIVQVNKFATKIPHRLWHRAHDRKWRRPRIASCKNYYEEVVA